MTDDENREIDNEIIDLDLEQQLAKLADRVLPELDLQRRIEADWAEQERARQMADLECEQWWETRMADPNMSNEPPADGGLQHTQEALVALGWPHALAKATWDPFFYAVGLRSGVVLYFVEAEVMESGWVRLKEIRGHTVPPIEDRSDYPLMTPFSFERGFEVRLEEIVWVADAPYGS